MGNRLLQGDKLLICRSICMGNISDAGRIHLETDRLILRPWKKNKADAKALYEYAKDPRIGPNAGWPVHRDVSESMEIIRNVLSTPGICAVVWKETERPIGAAGITSGSYMRKSLPRGDGELGYWIGRPWQGKGIATEAAQAMIAYGFDALHLDAVWGAYYEGNECSRRVQEKCGLQYVYTEENSYVEALQEYKAEHFMRITRGQWENQHT